MIPVMLIEDEFLVRIGLKTCVDWKAFGYEIVAEAEDGETALELYEQKKPQLILTDIRLPHKSGLEVMKEIRAVDREVRFIIISAFDDFKIAQEAIRLGVEGYFVKGSLNPEELTEMLDKMKEKYFRDALTLQSKQTYITELQDIYRQGNTQQIEKILDINIADRELYAVLIRAEEVDIESFSQMLHMFLEQQETEHRLWKHEKNVWFFLSPNNHAKQELFEKMKVMIKRYIHTNVRIGVSQNYYEKMDVKSMMFEAVLAAESLGDNEGIQLEYYTEKESFDMYIRASLKKVEELFKVKQFELCLNEVNHLKKILKKNGCVQQFYSVIWQLTGWMVGYVNEISSYNDILETLDYEEIFGRLESGIRRIAEVENAEDKDNVYILRAKEYVHEHYEEQINISIIAQYVHVSASYLGKVFLSETGEYLTDFINKVKMEKAKELLSERKYAVNEVAFRVGVADQRYFSKMFKRYCGVSPKEYVNRVIRNTH